MSTLFSTALTVAIGTVLIVAPGQAALAADHSAELDSGYATITLDLGAGAANATASVLILDRDADVDSPRQGDIVYLNQVTMGADGTRQFRVMLDGGALDDYVIASNVAGAARYVAPLAEVAGGGGTPRPGGSTGGDTGSGSGTGRTGSGSTGGSSGTGSGSTVDAGADATYSGSGGSSGTGGTASGSTDGEPRPSGSAQPAMADWIVPTIAGVGILAAVAGGALLTLRRRRLRESSGAAQASSSAEETADHRS